MKIALFGRELLTISSENEAEKQPNTDELILDAQDRMKVAFIRWAGLIGPLALGLVLAVSNSYFFAGFQPFNLYNIDSWTAWLAGFAIEAITLASLFKSVMALRHGDKKVFRQSIVWTIILSVISFTCQYMYLQMEHASGKITVDDQAATSIPFISMFIGGDVEGHDLLFLFRSAAFHVAEIACGFLGVKSLPSAEKIMEAATNKALVNFAKRTTQAEVIQQPEVSQVVVEQEPVVLRAVPNPIKRKIQKGNTLGVVQQTLIS